MLPICGFQTFPSPVEYKWHVLLLYIYIYIHTWLGLKIVTPIPSTSFFTCVHLKIKLDGGILHFQTHLCNMCIYIYMIYIYIWYIYIYIWYIYDIYIYIIYDIYIYLYRLNQICSQVRQDLMIFLLVLNVGNGGMIHTNCQQSSHSPVPPFPHLHFLANSRPALRRCYMQQLPRTRCTLEYILDSTYLLFMKYVAILWNTMNYYEYTVFFHKSVSPSLISFVRRMHCGELLVLNPKSDGRKTGRDRDGRAKQLWRGMTCG